MLIPDQMCICDAIKQMRLGAAVARVAWADKTLTVGLINLPFAFWQASGTFPDVMISRWVPVADDLLFDDWIVVAPGHLS